MPQENGRKYVTWRQLLLTFFAIVGSGWAVVSWVMSAHASRPHAGSASKREVDQLRDSIAGAASKREVDQLRGSIESRLIRIENKIDRVLEK